MVGLNVSPKIIYHINKDNNRIEYHWELQSGYFLSRNWLLGPELSYTRVRDKNNGEIGNYWNTYRIGLFTRKYFDIGQTKWKPLVGISGGYALRQIKTQNPFSGSTNFAKGGMMYVNAEVGMAYFIGNKTSFHVSSYVLSDFSGNQLRLGNISISLLKLGISHNLAGKNRKE
jgi:hypothetical protein